MTDEQINNLKEALQFSPNNTVLRKMLAEALFNLTRYQEAENEYKILLDIDSSADIKTGLAKCFYQLQKVEASHILLDEILKQEPDHAEANYYFAKASFLKGDFKQAKLSYDIASSLNDDFEDDDFELQVNQKLRESGMAVANLADDLNENDDNFFADIEKPKINFSDVGGMDKVKEEIALKVIHPLNNPEIYKAFGKKIGGGILLYGPPGCGKTHIARATAGEIKANFISVGISDVLDMWQGNSEKNLHSLFQKARNSTPCVLFFDEVDAMGASRSDMRSNSSRFLINQFLEEMDGVKHSNEGVLIMAATNSPWYVDSAFRRSGRFDRIIFVSPPDATAREEILNIYLKDKPTEQIDIKSIVKSTEEFTGADMKALVDVAIESKIPESIKQNRVIPINTSDLKKAVSMVKSPTKEWFSSAKNYALYSNDGGQYDDILKYLNLKK